MSETAHRPNSRKRTARGLAAAAAVVLASAALAAPQMLDDDSRDEVRTEQLSPEEIRASDLTDVKTIETPKGTSILTAHEIEHGSGTDTILALQLELDKRKDAPDFIYVDGIDVRNTDPQYPGGGARDKAAVFRRMPKDIKPITRSDGIQAIPMIPDNSGEWQERIFIVPRDDEVAGDPARAFETKKGDTYVEVRLQPMTEGNDWYAGESFVDNTRGDAAGVIFPHGLRADLNQPVLEEALPR